MKRIIATLALCLLTAPLAMAQDGRGGNNRQQRLPGNLDRFLMMTQEQVAALRQHLADSRMTLQPINRQARMTNQMLEQALEDGADDATVGALLKQVRDLRGQAADLRNMQREAAPDAIGLNQEQRERLAFLQRALRAQAPARAALQLNLIGRGGAAARDGEGDDEPPMPTQEAGDDEMDEMDEMDETDDETLELLEEISENLRRLLVRNSVVPVAEDE